MLTNSSQITELEQQKWRNIITIEEVFSKANNIVEVARTKEYMLLILRIGMTLIPLILIFIGYHLATRKYKIDE